MVQYPGRVRGVVGALRSQIPLYPRLLAPSDRDICSVGTRRLKQTVVEEDEIGLIRLKQQQQPPSPSTGGRMQIGYKSLVLLAGVPPFFFFFSGKRVRGWPGWQVAGGAFDRRATEAKQRSGKRSSSVQLNLISAPPPSHPRDRPEVR